jgi:hypothetical protein
MTGFDAELYLRLLGERSLLDPSHQQRAPWQSELASAAQALVAVGAVEEEAADAVIDDYALAAGLRHAHGMFHHHRRVGRRSGATAIPAAPPSARRVVPCHRDLVQPTGRLHVRYVNLDDEATSVAITFYPVGSSRPGRRPRPGPPGPGMIGPAPITLVDDRATTATAHFNGMGGDGEWHGHLRADRPLALDTAWIEIGGERVELLADPVPAEVSVEPLGADSPARRHLWRLAASPGPMHGLTAEATEPAFAALVAAGALAPDDPTAGEVRAVMEVVGHGMPHPAGRLPEPWSAMLARRANPRGPTGALVIGADTVVVDGIDISLTSLESTGDDWTIEVELRGEGAVPWTPFGAMTARLRQVNWWARDDRGNDYLGQAGASSGGDGRSHAEIQYWPALDPAAGRIELLPTGETERAVIGVPLRFDATAGGAP